MAHAINHIAYQHLITATEAVFQSMYLIVVPLRNEEGQNQMQNLLYFLEEIKVDQDEEEDRGDGGDSNIPYVRRCCRKAAPHWSDMPNTACGWGG